jgi:hypothetical protein
MPNRFKYFTLKYDKYVDSVITSFKDAVDEVVFEWEDELQFALSDNLPQGMKGRLRQPRSRLFPYMESGELKDSVTYKVDLHRSNSNKSAVITVDASIGSNHGLNGRDDAGWLGWMNDVLHRPQGRGDVPSLVDVFSKANKIRRKI